MHLKDHFSNEETKALCARSDARAWVAVVVNWGMIVACFAMVAAWTNVLTLLLALILLGGRQLGLGVLMHECGHGTLFRTRWLNRFIGEWLCAAPMFYRLDDYMANHLRHHARAGSVDDPDLSRYQNYPVNAASLRRKLWRDLSGRTTLNFLQMSLKKHGAIRSGENGSAGFDFLQFLRHFHPCLLANVLILAALTLVGLPWLYLLWLAAYFSSYMFFSRIRNLAEHAAVPDQFDPDPVLHTRTTIAGWWEKLTFAPNNVNYHLEHHLLPSVPKYRLAEFHEKLRQKNLLQQADITQGYIALIRKLVSKPATIS